MNDRPFLLSEMAPQDKYNRSGQSLQTQNMVTGHTGGLTLRVTVNFKVTWAWE